MPREYKGPKLWLDRARGTWTIIDRRINIRTGYVAGQKAEAMEALRKYADGHPVAPPAPPKSWTRRREKKARQYGVYIAGFGPYVKIGVSIDIPERMTKLQMPEKVELYSALDGWIEEERALHKRFAEYRLNGEWFRREGELADWIGVGCK